MSGTDVTVELLGPERGAQSTPASRHGPLRRTADGGLIEQSSACWIRRASSST